MARAAVASTGIATRKTRTPIITTQATLFLLSDTDNDTRGGSRGPVRPQRYQLLSLQVTPSYLRNYSWTSSPFKFFDERLFGTDWHAIDNRSKKGGVRGVLGYRLSPSYGEANDSSYRSRGSRSAVVVVACWDADRGRLC